MAASPLLSDPDFKWAVPLAVAGLPAVLAIFYGLAVALARMLWPDGLGRIAMLAVAFGILEWLRSFVLTGFPWNAIGYTAMPIPIMMQPVRLIGVEGMTLLAVFVFAMPALLGTGKGARVGIPLAALLVAADFGYGHWAMQRFAARPGKSEISVRLVQPVIGLDEGNTDESRTRNLRQAAHAQQAPARGGKEADLIVWPETAIPFILTEKQEAFTRVPNCWTTSRR